MSELGYESKKREHVSISVEFMRSNIPVARPEHEIVQNEDGTTKACVSLPDDFNANDQYNMVNITFVNGVKFMVDRLRSPDFKYSDTAVQEAGRLSLADAYAVIWLMQGGSK